MPCTRSRHVQRSCCLAACRAASSLPITVSPTPAPMQVHHRIVEALLQLVEAERGGEAVNRHLLKHAVGGARTCSALPAVMRFVRWERG